MILGRCALVSRMAILGAICLLACSPGIAGEAPAADAETNELVIRDASSVSDVTIDSVEESVNTDTSYSEEISSDDAASSEDAESDVMSFEQDDGASDGSDASSASDASSPGDASGGACNQTNCGGACCGELCVSRTCDGCAAGTIFCPYDPTNPYSNGFCASGC